jgi:hypothetical protein
MVGLADLAINTARAVSVNLPSLAGQLGAGYAIPISAYQRFSGCCCVLGAHPFSWRTYVGTSPN